MEAKDSSEKFPYVDLVSELDCGIMPFVSGDSFPISPTDVVLDESEYSHEGWHVHSIAWKPDGKEIAMCGHSDKRCDGVGNSLYYAWASKCNDMHWTHPYGKISVIDLCAGKRTYPLERSDYHIRSICLSPDTKYQMVVLGDANESTIELDEIVEAKPGCVTMSVRKWKYNPGVLVRAQAWSHDSKYLACCHDGGSVVIIDPPRDLRKYACGESREEHKLYSVDWSPDDRYIVSVGNGSKLYIIDLDSDEVRAVQVSDNDAGVIHTVKWAPGGKYVALGGDDKLVRIIDPTTGEVRAQYAHDASVETVCWSPCGKFIASCGYDNVLRIKSVMRFLLATFPIDKSTFSRYWLLERIQSNLLKTKMPLIIGQSDSGALEERPELKELLCIEDNRNTEDKKAMLWRLQLRRADITGAKG